MKESILSDIANTLGISQTAVSTRLIFVKTWVNDTVWHIADYAELSGGGKLILALHGAYIPHPVEADSILQMSLKETGELFLCEGCTREFIIARDVIQRKERTAFTERGGRIGRELI